MFDGKQVGEDVVSIVKSFMEREIVPLKDANAGLEARLAELEARKPEKGEQGEKGDPGERGDSGADGKDGAGIIDAFVSREGHLIATLSDGTTRDFGEIVGKDGRDGMDGKDGRDASNPEELTKDDVLLISATLRKEIGDQKLIVLPDPPPLMVAKATPPVNVTVENHLPKRGTEKTVVTKHDELGRIVEFERREV